MPRAFPILYATDVETTAAFYESLGFRRHFPPSPDGPAGYVGLQVDGSEMAVVAEAWPSDHYGMPRGPGPSFEMFVYVFRTRSGRQSLRNRDITELTRVRPELLCVLDTTYFFARVPDTLRSCRP